MTELHVIGEPIFAKNADGTLVSRIGTLFLRSSGLVTTRNVHALQRLEWLAHLNAQRAAAGKPPLSDFDADAEMEEAVDLIFSDNTVLIRPIPTKYGMELAFRADTILQQSVSKLSIRFLNIQNPVVRQALRVRGEAWRMSPVPMSEEAIRDMILKSRTSIHGNPIYYYNPHSGSRFLSYDVFKGLHLLDEQALRAHLIEIRDYSSKRNRFGQLEVDFFPRDCGFTRKNFEGLSFETMPAKELFEQHTQLAEAFERETPVLLRRDDVGQADWRQAMCDVLTRELQETTSDDVVRGLAPEFFMQVRWLPGGRIENGELALDEIFTEAGKYKGNVELQRLCDLTTRSILRNNMREFIDVEYINIGLISSGINARRDKVAPPVRSYIIEVKEKAFPQPHIRIARMQKWPISAHLNSGKDFTTAIMEATSYADYVVDRWMACRQLGMHLPQKLSVNKVRETYHWSPDPDEKPSYIWSNYFVRDYIDGRASNKIPAEYYASEEFNRELATLLGEAAAPNIIVGRALDNGPVIFDDGNEVIQFDAENHACGLKLTDLTGAFSNYQGLLMAMVPEYTRVLDKRQALMPNVREFIDIYTEAFRVKCLAIQQDYQKRKGSFEELFKDLPRDAKGSFGYRWESVLDRLAAADMDMLADRLFELCLRRLNAG